jgi:GcrA cell cycle regulator
MSGWTDERIKILTHMWADASNTASLIGEAIGMSRNAVVGKRKRLGLPERRNGRQVRNTEPQEAKPQKLKRQPKPQKFRGKRFLIPSSKRALPKLEPKSQIVMEVPAPRMLDLVDLTERTCKWPATDVLPHKFCGQQKESGVPYCAFHQRRASARMMGS